jgi:hypothetical protein
LQFLLLGQPGIESKKLLLVWGDFTARELYSALRVTALYLYTQMSVSDSFDMLQRDFVIMVNNIVVNIIVCVQ